MTNKKVEILILNFKNIKEMAEIAMNSLEKGDTERYMFCLSEIQKNCSNIRKIKPKGRKLRVR